MASTTMNPGPADRNSGGGEPPVESAGWSDAIASDRGSQRTASVAPALNDTRRVRPAPAASAKPALRVRGEAMVQTIRTAFYSDRLASGDRLEGRLELAVRSRGEEQDVSQKRRDAVR